MIDLGYGYCKPLRAIAKRVRRAVGVDQPALNVSLCKTHPNIELCLVDYGKLDTKSELVSGAFDKATAFSSLELSVMNGDLVLSFFKGVFAALKPGGLFYVHGANTTSSSVEAREALKLGLIANGIKAETARKVINSDPWQPKLQELKEMVQGVGFEWVEGREEKFEREVSGIGFMEPPYLGPYME